jgi:hypothetical protein
MFEYLLFLGFEEGNLALPLVLSMRITTPYQMEVLE